MHGLGNDYVYVDLKATPLDPAAAPALARRVSPRRVGVGSDGLILIGPSAVADARMHMFNADGSRGRMCGNGARCVARYVYERWTRRTPATIETDGGVRTATISFDAQGRPAAVSIDLGAPRLDAEEIPCRGEGRVVDAALKIPGCCEAPLRPRLTCVNLGNPHAVTFVEDVATAPVEILGPEIERDPFFPEGVNVEFVRVVGPERLEIRVWERGSGETSACGTGAAAAVVAATLVGRLVRGVRVAAAMPGGEAHVTWRADGAVVLEGPAEFAFEGVIDAPELGDPVR
ncbi:MAG TPA: diaminopimelate epimerase [Planctomycetota bacterium]|nr:diaminopimelate epimerase [Planctomycetota bacterium]